MQYHTSNKVAIQKNKGQGIEREMTVERVVAVYPVPGQLKGLGERRKLSPRVNDFLDVLYVILCDFKRVLKLHVHQQQRSYRKKWLQQLSRTKQVPQHSELQALYAENCS